MMDKENARQLLKLVHEFDKVLNDSAGLARELLDGEELDHYLHSVGHVLAASFFRIEKPWYLEYPDLAPPGLRDDMIEESRRQKS